MINFKEYLPVTFPVLYVGLKEKWLTAKEIVTIFNVHFDDLDCDNQILIDVNVNEEDEEALLLILKAQAESQEHIGIKGWQFAYLTAIEQSSLSLHERLKEIELQWSRFNYPDSWKSFIYYLPNEQAKSEEDLYQNFLFFLNSKKSGGGSFK